MLVICSWCKKKLGEKEPLADKTETHTICEECEKKFEEEDKLSQ